LKIPQHLEVLQASADEARLYTPAFFTMAAANFLILTGFSTFFLFPLFIMEHGGNELDIGIIMGIFTLASVACRPWISSMIDRIGRKQSYTIGSVIMTLFPCAYLLFQGALSDFYVPLLLVRIVHGMGFAICLTAAFTFIADVIPPKRLNEGLGIFGVSGITGTAIGPVAAEFIIEKLGFQVLFGAAGFMGLLAFCAHLGVKETLERRAVQRVQSFFAAFQRKRFVVVASIAVLFGFGLAASNNFVAPFAVERRIHMVSLYYASYSLAAVLSRFLGGRLADSLGEEKIIPAALIVTGMGLASLVLVGTTTTLILSGLMGGVGHGFLYPCLNALAIRGEAIETRGRITGLFTGSIDAGVLLGSLLLGVVGRLAGFESLFILAGLSLLGGFLMFLNYPEKESPKTAA
jgi:MFS family permease